MVNCIGKESQPKPTKTNQQQAAKPNHPVPYSSLRIARCVALSHVLYDIKETCSTYLKSETSFFTGDQYDRVPYGRKA
jgi:hypothetical protein